MSQEEESTLIPQRAVTSDGAEPPSQGIAGYFGANKKPSLASYLATNLVAILILSFEFVLWNKYKNASCEKPLATWCLYMAILSSVGIVFGFFIRQTKNPEEMDGFTKVVGALQGLVGLASFVGLIYGCTMVYSMPFDNPKCPLELFHFVWYLLTISLSILGTICFCVCCCAAAFAALANSRREAATFDH